ncbi:hypothetical protein ABES02_13305 [Neobacillus pocheonensis]|uniref:hypothetical protein n=1 Tax=Neobacillus pocheonensis TaxID=363869 RepID=UPI003D29D61F
MSYFLPDQSQQPLLIHVSSGPENVANSFSNFETTVNPNYFSAFVTAVYFQRYGIPVTLFFNGKGVNGLIKGRMSTMIGSPDTEKTITEQLGMTIPEFLHEDHPQNMYEWAQTFVRHGGQVIYCGTTNTWAGNAKSWSDTSKMETFASPLNIQQVAAILMNKDMKYITL